MEVKQLETEKGLIDYTDEGSGSPILIVHGGNDNCRTNVRQDSLLAAGYRVLIPSRPGYGKTDIRYGQSAAEQAQFISTFLELLGIPRVAVLSYSAGGAVALEFSALYPTKTSCLILEESMSKRWVSWFNPQYYAMKILFHPGRQSKLWKKQREEYASTPRKHLLKLCKMFSTLPAAMVLSEWSESDRWYYEDGLNLFDSGSGFIATMDHVARNIAAVKAPTLIIHSPFDKNIPFSHALYAHRKISQSRLFVAPAKSHLIYTGDGVDSILKKRLDFLSGIM